MQATGPSVLVVDDDEDIVELMRDILTGGGFRVRTATTADDAMACLDDEPVDCVLLDVMMPGASGFELCRRIRETSDLPIIFLTARGGDNDKLRAFGLGADDYVVKSVTASEVMARLRAVLRRARPQAGGLGATLDLGRLHVDLATREVFVEGRHVPLTAREFDLLVFLARHPRQVFTRQQLIDRIWGTAGDGHAVTVAISKLREKIEREPSRPRHVVTVWGVGYRFERAE